MQIDPRTVARDIPGVLDEIFPQLTPGIIAYFNQQAEIMSVVSLPEKLLKSSSLPRPMLFELAYSVAENMLSGDEVNWENCLLSAYERQRKYFDAKFPENFNYVDLNIAELVGGNLAKMLQDLASSHSPSLATAPKIPGLEWIASGSGDFSLGDRLVEVKCTAKRFSSADYRQVAIYWLLSYAAAIEGRGSEWREFVLLNPRSGAKVQLDFDRFLSVISSGRTKVDILQLFQSLVGTRFVR